MTSLLNTIKSQISARTTEQLILAAKHMGNSRSNQDANLIRGLILTEIENRCGVDAVDALMDEMGM